MLPLNRHTAQTFPCQPERIIQFGGGNFLRAFVDWVIEILNEQAGFAGSVVIVKPTPQGSYQDLDEQEGLFHVHLRGIRQGQLIRELKLITCVSRTVNPYQDYQAFLSLAEQPEIRFIFSNTTEAGIVFEPKARLDDSPPTSFPAKLAVFLHHRYCHFHGDPQTGCIILPCELIEQNGEQLSQIILQHANEWGLEAGFKTWLETANIFCNTLVDRIVTGFPADTGIWEEIGFIDRFLAEGEVYHSWIIEAPPAVQEEFPVSKIGLNVRFVDHLKPYRDMKVRVLNGAHTAMVPIGIMLGLETVREVMDHPRAARFIEDLVFREILPTLDLPEDERESFAADVLDRFRNPFIQHRLSSIALNSLSKFKVRLLPSLLQYQFRYRQVPERMVVVFAALLRFYKGEWRGQPIPLADDPAQVAWLQGLWRDYLIPDLIPQVLQNQAVWGLDLSRINGLPERLRDVLSQLEETGFDGLIE